jgi:hypothetical protein
MNKTWILVLSIIICGCANPNLTTKDIEVTGTITGDQCNDGGKCIEFYTIIPQNIEFQYSDWDKIKPYFEKKVTIKGDLISQVNTYSCKDDYHDGMQHPINHRCEIPGMKYYVAKTYLTIDSIEPLSDQ